MYPGPAPYAHYPPVVGTPLAGVLGRRGPAFQTLYPGSAPQPHDCPPVVGTPLAGVLERCRARFRAAKALIRPQYPIRQQPQTTKIRKTRTLRQTCEHRQMEPGCETCQGKI